MGLVVRNNGNLAGIWLRFWYGRSVGPEQDNGGVWPLPPCLGTSYRNHFSETLGGRPWLREANGIAATGYLSTPRSTSTLLMRTPFCVVTQPRFRCGDKRTKLTVHDQVAAWNTTPLFSFFCVASLGKPFAASALPVSG
jgi:hypothetical protein